jgi:hypothetical protein
MVGGLKRVDGTVRPASDLTASKEVPTSDRVNQQGAGAGPSTSGISNGNGNENGQADADEEVVGSPDWPSDVEEDEEAERPVGRGREAVPSRSPPPVTNEDVVWRDPLDEDEDEDDEDGDVADGPPAKRRRDS